MGVSFVAATMFAACGGTVARTHDRRDSTQTHGRVAGRQPGRGAVNGGTRIRLDPSTLDDPHRDGESFRIAQQIYETSSARPGSTNEPCRLAGPGISTPMADLDLPPQLA
jgi:hypothetical protein